MEKKDTMAAAPFLKSKETTATLMGDVLIALMPTALFGVYRFGFRAFLILLLSVTSCVLTEHVYKKLRKFPLHGYEGSAMVTGVIFAMLLPAETPLWFPVVGGAVTIAAVKLLWGGLGKNLLNPAASGKVLFLVLTGFTMKNVTVSYAEEWSYSSLFDLFFGFGEGLIGTVSPFLLLLGGLYLVICGIISLRIPAAYLLSFTVILLMFGDYGTDVEWLAKQLCSGGVMLGAFFMATDYTTSPMTKTGKLVFGVIVGVMTGVLRVCGYTAGDVVCGVLFGNLLVPVIEKVTVPRFFGKGEKANL